MGTDWFIPKIHSKTDLQKIITTQCHKFFIVGATQFVCGPLAV